MFRRRPQPPAPNLLDLEPVRLAPWEERDGRAVVERLVPKDRGPGGWLLRVSFLTGVRKLRLDDLGSAVWLALDGATTVGEVAAQMRQRFGDGCEPAEERLQTFFSLLHRERLIGYPGHDDEAIAAWEARRGEAHTGTVAEAP
jgi:Coenzyme PQQ synthesis protein D (PqqD)